MNKLQQFISGTTSEEKSCIALLMSAWGGLVGISMLTVLAVWPGSGYREFLPVCLLGLATCIGTIYFARAYRLDPAVWMYAVCGGLGIVWMEQIIDDSQHYLVVGSIIGQMAMVAFTRRPHLTLVYGILIIVATILVDFVYGEPITSEKLYSILTIAILYGMFMVSFMAMSWLHESTISQLKQGNDALEDEIVRRKHAEKRMKVQQMELQLILDTAPVGICSLDRNGRFLSTNRMVETILGYSAETFQKMKWIEMIPAEEIESSLEATQEMIDGGEAYAYIDTERRAIHADGTLRDLKLSNAVVRDEEGEFDRFIVTIQDVSHEKRMEADLQASKERYERLFNDAPAMIHAVDATTMIIDVNEYWLKKMGYERDEVVGQFTAQFFTEASFKRGVEVDFPQFAEQGFAADLPYQMVTKQGDVLDVLLSGTNQTDEEGNFTFTLATIQDVTEQRLLERVIRKSERRFRTLVDSAPYGFFVYGDEGRLINVDLTACEMLGYTHDELVRKHVQEVDVEWSAETDSQHIAFLQSGGTLTLDTTYQRKDGILLPVRVRIVELGGDDEWKYVGLARDVTDERAAINALQLSEERYRMLYNSAPVMMHSVNEKKRIADVNQYWLDVMGYKREEVLNQPIVRFQTEEASQQIRDVYLPIFLEHGTVSNAPNVMVKKDGTKIEVILSSVLKRDETRNYFRSMTTLLDVTEKNRIEQALRESEDRYRDLYHNMPVMAHLVNVGVGEVVEVNQYWLDKMGYERNEVIGRPIWHFLTPASDMYFRENIIPSFHVDGVVNNVPVTLVTYRDEHIEVLLSSVLRQKDGVQYSRTIMLDITEEKRIQEEARQKDEWFKDVLNNMSDQFIVLDVEGTIVQVNDTFCEETGYIRGELIGVSIAQLEANFNTDGIHAEIEALFETGGSITYNGVGQNKNGIEASYESTAFVMDYEGEPHIVIFGRDVSERVAAEQALRQSEKRFKALFNDAYDFAAVLSSDGVVLDINERVEALIVLAHDTIDKQPIWKAGNFANLPKVSSTLKTMFETVKETNSDCREEISLYLKTLDRTITADVILTPVFDENDGIDLLLLEARDITQLVQTREALRKAAGEKTIMLQEIHHRVKNNLQIIMSILRMSQRQAKKAGEMAIANDYREVLGRVRSMTLIHEQLYTDDGDMNEVNMELYIRNLVYELLRTYRGKSKVDIQLEIDALHMNVSTAIPCGMIINDIVSNALKYAFPDSAGTITVSLTKQEQEIQLVVKDNGVGLPDSVEFPNKGSTGFRLIDLLTKQIGAKTNLIVENGTKYEILFSG